ncbi:hypothetical protein IKE83_01965 [Candidatus Saccharibacteria bacterium]|nr:hypothetical protein [Candidatus Saccharibacteria bacterium]
MKKNTESPNLDIYNLPDRDDKFGWIKYAENAKKVSNDHFQSGELIFPTFGSEIAVGAMRRYINQVKKMGKLHEMGAPKVILEKTDESISDQATNLIATDHESVAEFREILANLPQGLKNTQNQIFTSFANGYNTNSKYLLETLRPNVVTYEKAKRYAAFLMGERPERIRWYDFIGKLTEKDDTGRPTVSDETFTNFFEWYQASLAKAQKELNHDTESNIKDYANGVKSAVSRGKLPQSIVNNLIFFTSNSPRPRNLNFSLFDALGDGSRAAGAFARPELYNIFDHNAPIGIRADVVVEETQKYPVMWHELTHATSGDAIRFGNNYEATRIIDEALTEHISNIIMCSPEELGYDDDDKNFTFMSGKTYKDERKTIKEIATSGKVEVLPEVFYEAYVEYDPDFTGEPEWNEDELVDPVPKIGPKKQALYDALFEAYPECQTLEELGDVIVDRFNEIQKSA